MAQMAPVSIDFSGKWLKMAIFGQKCNSFFEYISKGLYRKFGIKKRVLF